MVKDKIGVLAFTAIALWVVIWWLMIGFGLYAAAHFILKFW